MFDRFLKKISNNNLKSSPRPSYHLRSISRPEPPTGFVARTDPSFANLARKF